MSLTASQERLAQKRQEVSLVEASGGRLGAIDKARLDMAGFQSAQRELMGQLNLISEKQRALSGRRLDPEEEAIARADLKTQRNEVESKLLDNRRSIAETQANLREQQTALELSRLDLTLSERQLELQNEELALLRSGLPYHKEQITAQQELRSVEAERASNLRKLQIAQLQLADLAPGFSEEEKNKRQQELINAQKAFNESEKRAIDAKNKVALTGLDQQLNAERRRHELTVSNLDIEKSKLDSQVKLLDIQSKLIQSRQNLGKALSDASISNSQIALDRINKQLEARKRLDSEDPFSMGLGVRSALSIIAGSQSEDELLRERQRIEDEITNKRLEAIKQEHDYAIANLEIEEQRTRLAAQRNLYDAQTEQLNADKAKREAEAALKKAETNRDSEAMADANNQIELARRQRSLADDKYALAEKELSTVPELLANQRQQLQTTQQTALNQENAANYLRKQNQELERQEAIANRKNRGFGSNNSGSSTGFSGVLQGEDIAKYRAAVTQYQQDLRSGGQVEIASKLASGLTDKFYALVAQSSGQGELVKLTDSLRNAGISQMQIQNTISNARFGGDIIGELQKLNSNIEGLANRPSIGSLSISSPNPVNDSSRVINDLNKNSLRG